MSYKCIMAAVLMTALSASEAADPAAAGGKTHQFKVTSANGVPQISMDGVPIRPRIFWGQTVWRGGGVKLDKDWTSYAYEFTVPETADNAELQLRFGKEPGKIELESVKIIDLESRTPVKDCLSEASQKQWSFWCPERDKNPPVTVAVADQLLTVVLTDDPRLGQTRIVCSGIAVRQGGRYRVELRARSGSPRFLKSSLNGGKRFNDLNILPGALADQLKLAAQSDINIVSFYVDSVWQEPGQAPDFSEIDLIIRYILKINPHALLLPRINLNNPPGWWSRANPGELTKFDDGSTVWWAPSIASVKYREEAVAALRRTIRYCEDMYGPNMIGYHPAGGSTDEWFYQGTWANRYTGYDPATLQAWRGYLRQCYGSDAALQKAWGNSQVTLDTVPVPDGAMRNSVSAKGLRQFADPVDAPVIDFARFQQESMAGMITALAKALREETLGNRLSVFFYGYVFEFAAVWTGPAVSGHYALRRVLNSPDIDILAAPVSYGDRRLGGGGNPMSAVESIALAGKMWFNEDDTNTYLATQAGNLMSGPANGANDRDETIRILRRNLASALTRNFGIWWMDLLGSGWFNDPALWADMRTIAPADLDLLQNPQPFQPEIAAVVDEESLLYILSRGASGASSGPLITAGSVSLNRIGAPYGQYLLADYLAGKTHAKLNVFLAVYALDGKQRREVKALAQNAGAIWCWAPGALDLDQGRISAAAVTELTGFEVKVATGMSMRLIATPAGRAIGLPTDFGVKFAVTPLYSPVPTAGDTVLATYSNQQPAIVLRTEKYPQLFVGGSTIPAALYRHMAKLSKVHLYTDREANVYANGKLVAVSAAEDGKLVFDPGPVSEIKDIFDGGQLKPARPLTLELKKGQTKLFVVK